MPVPPQPFHPDLSRPAAYTPTRGVRKVYDDVNPGTVVYRITLSSGDRIKHEMRAELADAQMDEIAEMVLEIRDPQLQRPTLKLA
jgi:hypothetical protein